MIRRFGVLNDQMETRDAFLYGIPYPGAFVADENGIVVAKFFRDSYKKRDSPETLIDAALGRLELASDAPHSEGGDPEVRITATVHGGKGTLRQGIVRQLVVHFDLDPGLHLYGEPVPPGLTSTQVEVTGPPGLVVEDPVLPPTEPLHVASASAELAIYPGAFDIVVPFYADGRLASEVRPLDMESARVEVGVRYQACNRDECFLPRTETLHLDIPLDVVDIPAISLHEGHGQRAGNYDGTPHLRRLLMRKARAHPLGIVRFALNNLRLEAIAAWRRRRRKRRR